MLDAPVRRALAERLKLLHIVFLALLGSLVVYLVVAYVIAADGEPPGTDIDVMVPILGVMGLGSLVAAFILRGVLLRGGLARLPAQITEDDAGHVAGASFTSAIVGWAMCESVAIYGLVLFFLSHRWEIFLPFWGAGLVAMLLQAPSLRHIEEALRRRSQG